jgi:hypothetical protein
MADSWTIVTGSDAAYFPLLQGLLASIADAVVEGVPPVQVLDLGMETEQLRWLEGRVQSVVAPEWDISSENARAVEKVLGPAARALTSRPHLPQYFPGFQTYLWLDCDLWIQRWECVQWFIAAAEHSELAIVPQIDRSFRCMWRAADPSDPLFRYYTTCVGEELAGKLAFQLPQFNNGAFALRCDSNTWQIWAELIEQILDRLRASGSMFHLFEQLALSLAIYFRGVPAYCLPAIANWPVGESLPWVDANRRLLIEPLMPYQPLGIVHLILHAYGAAGKLAPAKLTTIEGQSLEQPLDYLSVRSWLWRRDDDWAEKLLNTNA